jgi:hypothetical protein
MARSGLAAIAMYLSLTHVHAGRHGITAAVRILIGAPVYAVLIVLIDADARALLRRLGGHLRKSARDPQAL